VEEGRGGARACQPTRQEPPKEATGAGVNPNDPIPALDASDLDVVRANKPRTLHVDQLAIEHVLLQQHLLGPTSERLQIKPRLAQRYAAGADLADYLSRDEHRSTCHRRTGAGHRLVLIVRQAAEQVFDLTEPKTARVAHLAARDQRQMKDLRRDRHRASVGPRPRVRGWRPIAVVLRVWPVTQLFP